MQDNANDPLLTCLELVCNIHEIPFIAHQATQGLMLQEGHVTPSLLITAAEQLGYKAELIRIKLDALDKLTLPAILILKNNQACVLKEISNHELSILPAKPNATPQGIKQRELADHFANYAITLQRPEYTEKRATDFRPEETKSWFWQTLLTYRNIYFHIGMAALLTNIFVFVSPLFIMNTYDRVIPHGTFDTLWLLALGAFIFFIFDFIVRQLRSHLIDVTGRKIDVSLARQFFKHMLGLRMANKPASAGVFANYFNELENLREFFTSATIIALIDLPFILLFLIVIYLIGAYLVWIPIIGIILALSASVLSEIPTQHAIHRLLIGSSQKQAILIETLQALETIKSFGLESTMNRKWEQSLRAFSDANVQSVSYTALAANITIFLQQLVVIGVTIGGVYLILQNQLSIGGLIACTILASRSMMLGQFSNLLTRIARTRNSLATLTKIMQLEHETATPRQFIQKEIWHGDIQFSHVSFYYPQSDVPALTDIQCHIKPGEHMAVIGRIGAGKSTLLKLIAKLYRPQQGYIQIDNTDLNELNPVDIRQHVVYLGQDNVLLYGSLRENLTFGLTHVSDEQLETVARLTGVDRIVHRHPQGYDMPLGERGEFISTGQRRTILLARTLLSNAPILLLDEPTTHMDEKTEQHFIHELPHYIRDKTVIFVTHKPSLLKLADRILVLEAGKIVADGPADKILAAISQPQQNNRGE